MFVILKTFKRDFVSPNGPAAFKSNKIVTKLSCFLQF